MTIIDYTCTVPVSYWMLGQNVSHINTSSADLWEVRLLPGLSFMGVDHVVTNYLGHHDLVQVEHQTLMFQLGRTVSKLKTLDFESNWPKSFHEFSWVFCFSKKNRTCLWLGQGLNFWTAWICWSLETNLVLLTWVPNSSHHLKNSQLQTRSESLDIPCLIEALGQCGATTTETEGISKIRPVQNLRVSSPENASLKSLEFRQ